MLNPNFVYNLNYTQLPSNKKDIHSIQLNLQKYWNSNNLININNERIYIRKGKSDETLKWNKYGVLGIQDHKGLVMILHNAILNKIMNRSSNNSISTELQLSFFLGVLEGDNENDQTN